MTATRALAGALGVAAMASFVSTPSWSQEHASAVAQISLSPAEGSLVIKGSAIGVSVGTVSGELTIDRKGQSGSVVTRQTRTMTLEPGEVADVASVSVSFQPGDEIAVDLVLSENGLVVATASATTGDKNRE